MHRWIAWVGVVVLAFLTGCAAVTDPLGRQDSLEEAQRRYTDLVRWGQLDRAEQFVDPELRAAFKQDAGRFGSFRITDHETGELEMDGRTAYVTVTYKGYAISHLVEHTSQERQEWYRTGVKNVWRVRPQLALVMSDLQGRPPEAAAE